jgi:hypothetical protein
MSLLAGVKRTTVALRSWNERRRPRRTRDRLHSRDYRRRTRSDATGRHSARTVNQSRLLGFRRRSPQIRNPSSLPTRRLIRSDDWRTPLVGSQDRHEGRCGNFHDRHAVSDCRPAYVNLLAGRGGRIHRDPAGRYNKRDAPPKRLSGLASLHRSRGPRGLAMIHNSRILSKGRGDSAENDRETNRYTQSGSHQPDTLPKAGRRRRRYSRSSCLHWPELRQLKKCAST